MSHASLQWRTALMYVASKVYPFLSINCSTFSENKLSTSRTDCLRWPVTAGYVRFVLESNRASVNLSSLSLSGPPRRVHCPTLYIILYINDVVKHLQKWVVVNVHQLSTIELQSLITEQKYIPVYILCIEVKPVFLDELEQYNLHRNWMHESYTHLENMSLVFTFVKHFICDGMFFRDI